MFLCLAQADAYRVGGATCASSPPDCVAATVAPPGESYRLQCEFADSDEYAAYVRDHVQVGMAVWCCRAYEEVAQGDQGVVLKVGGVGQGWSRGGGGRGGAVWCCWAYEEVAQGDQGVVLKVGGVGQGRGPPTRVIITCRWVGHMLVSSACFGD